MAESATAVNAALMSGSRRIDSTPYVPKSPSPNSNTMTSGWPLAISVRHGTGQRRTAISRSWSLHLSR